MTQCRNYEASAASRGWQPPASQPPLPLLNTAPPAPRLQRRLARKRPEPVAGLGQRGLARVGRQPAARLARQRRQQPLAHSLLQHLAPQRVPGLRAAARSGPPPAPPGAPVAGPAPGPVSAHCASVVIALPGPIEKRWAASMRFCARAVLLASPDEAALPQAQGMSQSTRRGRLCTDYGTETVPTTAGDWLYASTALPHAHLQTPPWRCQPPARLGDVGHARGAEELERLAQQALAVLWQDLHACTSTQYSATY